MALTAENWPIAAALLQFPSVTRDGAEVQDQDPELWGEVFDEVVRSGFTAADLTDTWLRVGDLDEQGLTALKEQSDRRHLSTPSISVIRRSVIDEASAADNLAYVHRTIDAAAVLDAAVVSVGLHQALTVEQKERLWFWTVEGYKDPANDGAAWNAVVSRLRELGRHAAEVGVLLSLEMYEDTYLGTGDSAVRLVEDIGLPNVGINPDVANLVRLHRPIDDWYETFAKTLPYTNYWHVKGYVRDENVEREMYVAIPSPMESGLINYREIVKLALRSGFQGIICAESYGGDGLTVSARNQAYLREFLLPEGSNYPPGTSQVLQQVERNAAFVLR